MKKLSIGLILLLLLALLTKTDYLLPIDEMIYSYIQKIQNPTLTSIILKITELGSGEFYTIACILLIILKNRNGLVLIMNTGFGFVMNFTLKNIVARARPIDRLAVEVGYSFPSSHTTCAVMFYGMAAYLVYRSKLAYKKQFSFMLIMMIPIIAFTRVYLHVHYFSDVVGGILFGCILLKIMNDKVFVNMLD